MKKSNQRFCVKEQSLLMREVFQLKQKDSLTNCKMFFKKQRFHLIVV